MPDVPALVGVYVQTPRAGYAPVLCPPSVVMSYGQQEQRGRLPKPNQRPEVSSRVATSCRSSEGMLTWWGCCSSSSRFGVLGSDVCRLPVGVRDHRRARLKSDKPVASPVSALLTAVPCRTTRNT